jgi:hypothetical protein
LERNGFQEREHRGSERQLRAGNLVGHEQRSNPRLTFDNLTVGGITVLTNIFKTNAYVYNLRFTNSAPRVITGLTAGGGSLSFNITNNGSYVGLPGTNGASIFAVTNNGAWVVQASSSLANPNGWIRIATNVAPFAFTDTNAMAGYPQRFYRVTSP